MKRYNYRVYVYYKGYSYCTTAYETSSSVVTERS